MSLETCDRLAASIYDAALGSSSWDDALLEIARATNAIQSTLEVHEPLTGVAHRHAPLCDPAFRRSYKEQYERQFSLSGKTLPFAVGRCFRTEDMLPDRGESLRRSAFYNDWWRPQGSGGAALYCNIAKDARTTALASIYKPHHVAAFNDDEQRLFQFAVAHLVRAVEVERRLRRAQTAMVHVGDAVAIVDQDMRILTAGPSALNRLARAKLIVADGWGDRLRSGDGALERLVASAGSKRPRSGGEVQHRAGDGSAINIAILPCDERSGDEARWLTVDRPAALLLVEAPAERRSMLVERLKQAYGLTGAEAAVAIEIALGAGRASAAKRLGIGEATVRTHLTAVFDKVGVRRQAALARLVATF